MIRPLLCIVVASALLPATALAQCVKRPSLDDKYSNKALVYFEAFPYSKQLLSAEDEELMLNAYSKHDEPMSTFVRAVIFGRHGRVFADSSVQFMLTDTKWYKPNAKFSNTLLNDIERQNLDIVRGIEAKEHRHVMPGDLRFWKNKRVPEDHPWNSSPVELHIMRAEIEAIHGKKFDDQPWLQKYFSERYWYKPASKYDPKSLNEHERANMRLFAKVEAKKSGQSLVPGSLLAYGDKPITSQLLKNLNLYHLRILRNEIYAIRGATFHTEWIQWHFETQDWYSPLPKSEKPKLTALDQKNIATILKKENELHLALSTKRMKGADFAGMLSDDASKLRNEIYARRGKVFKNKWLQSYFSSLPWYKANPGYSDKLLTKVEKENIRTIARYEKQALERESMEEG